MKGAKDSLDNAKAATLVIKPPPWNVYRMSSEIKPTGNSLRKYYAPDFIFKSTSNFFVEIFWPRFFRVRFLFGFVVPF